MKPTKKMGRPKIDNPKKSSLNIRLSEQEKEKIKKVADLYNTTLVDAVLRGIDLLEKTYEKK